MRSTPTRTVAVWNPIRSRIDLWHLDTCLAVGTISSHSNGLEYHIGDHDLDISKVPIRDWLLAKAFPSRTGPMGSGANKKWPPVTANFDMSAEFKTNPNKWYQDKKYNGEYEWKHSDWKNAPYVYVYKLFEKITSKED